MEKCLLCLKMFKQWAYTAFVSQSENLCTRCNLQEKTISEIEALKTEEQNYIFQTYFEKQLHKMALDIIGSSNEI